MQDRRTSHADHSEMEEFPTTTSSGKVRTKIERACVTNAPERSSAGVVKSDLPDGPLVGLPHVRSTREGQRLADACPHLPRNRCRRGSCLTRQAPDARSSMPGRSGRSGSYTEEEIRPVPVRGGRCMAAAGSSLVHVGIGRSAGVVTDRRCRGET